MGQNGLRLPALIPAATYFVLGALVNADDFQSTFKDDFTSWTGWYCVTWFVIFLFTTAYASLVVKWGAFPLAVFLVFFSQMVLFTVFTAISWNVFGISNPREEMMMSSLLVVSVPIIPLLARLIPKRLKKLASR